MKGLVSLIPSMLVAVNAPPGMSHSPQTQSGPLVPSLEEQLSLYLAFHLCLCLAAPSTQNSSRHQYKVCGGLQCVGGWRGDLTLYVQCHACACSYVVHIH